MSPKDVYKYEYPYQQYQKQWKDPSVGKWINKSGIFVYIWDLM